MQWLISMRKKYRDKKDTAHIGVSSPTNMMTAASDNIAIIKKMKVTIAAWRLMADLNCTNSFGSTNLALVLPFFLFS